MRYGLKKIKIQGQELFRHKHKNPLNTYIAGTVDDNKKNMQHASSRDFHKFPEISFIRFT